MKTLGLIFSWFWGIFFLLVGISFAVYYDPLSSIPLLIITLLLIPPIRKFAYSKINFKLPFYARAVSIIILISISGHLAGESQQKKNIEYFIHNTASVIAKINALIQSGDYETAVSLSEKYLKSDNKELTELHAIAKSKQLEIEDKTKTKQRIDDLRNEKESINKANFGTAVIMKLLRAAPEFAVVEYKGQKITVNKYYPGSGSLMGGSTDLGLLTACIGYEVMAVIKNGEILGLYCPIGNNASLAESLKEGNIKGAVLVVPNEYINLK